MTRLLTPDTGTAGGGGAEGGCCVSSPPEPRAAESSVLGGYGRTRATLGDGHKVLGLRALRTRRGSLGFDYIHSAVDHHSRFACSGARPDEKAAICAGFLRRAATFFAVCGIERVLTDNVWPYHKCSA